MLKSPRRSVDWDMEQIEVSSSDSSDRKMAEAEALGGRYIRTAWSCADPDKVKARHSSEVVLGTGSSLIEMSSLYITASPPPRPVEQGFWR